MRNADSSRWSLVVVVAVLASGCIGKPNVDGRYVVQRYTLNSTSCEGDGAPIDRGYTTFEVRERSFAGVDIFPVYPCDETGACQADNDEVWTLVVFEEDLDHVGIHFAEPDWDVCTLRADEKTITPGPAGEVVFQSRRFEVDIPWDPDTCTTDNAKAMRGQMKCGGIMELVGMPEEAPQP